MVSLSGCTYLTSVLPKPFLTPPKQTFDPGLENLISASAGCLSYILILATWVWPGDCLTPDSGATAAAALLCHHSLGTASLPSQTGGHNR